MSPAGTCVDLRRNAIIRSGSILVMLLLVICITHCSDDHDAVSPGGSRIDYTVPGVIYSPSVGDSLRVYVSVPEDYEHDVNRVYPTIYLVDGDYFFDGTHPRWGYATDSVGVRGLVSELADSGSIPEVILIAIGYPGENQRGRDFLLAYDNFYEFLTGELIRLVDEEYRTDTSLGRTIMGHSDGGFFTMYCWARFRPGANRVFDKFVATSGDYTKLSGITFSREEYIYHLIGSSGVLPNSVFLGVGGLEEPRFTESNQQLAEVLDSRGYPDFRLEYQEFGGLNHGTVIKPGFTAGLLWVFNSPDVILGKLHGTD